MATTVDATRLPRQLHVKLSERDFRKLERLAKGANLSTSEAIRTMIRGTSTINPAEVNQENGS
jgi:hypothetical protein